MKINKVKLSSKFKSFNDLWSPKIVGELNGQQVKIAKVNGEFTMHHHVNEDEFFYVIKGTLFIELMDQTLELHPGEFVIIPKGIDHKPFSHEETHIMLFEPASTINTGNKINELTVNDLEEI